MAIRQGNYLCYKDEKELDFKMEFGVDALEDKFEAEQFNYVDINRKGAV